MNKRQSLVKGTFILVSANILVKIIGAVFKIPLTNLIGASGMGDFSIAYNLYVIMFVVSTAGLPVAISKMVAEANSSGRSCDVYAILKSAFFVFCTMGFVFTCLLINFADEICDIIGSDTAYLSIISIAPAIFLTTIIAILRGYYQGHHNMTKTAISQLIEAVFKLFIGYFFAKYLLEQGYHISIASAGAIFGVTIGTFLSAIYLIICIVFSSKKTQKKSKTSYKNILKKLFSIAIPITVGASIISLTSVVDMMTILKRLQDIGVSPEIANELFGAYNMSMTIYNLPQTVISAVAISIIPIISENLQNKFKIEKIIKSALFLTFTFAMPCSVGFIILAKPLLDLLYYKRPEDVLMASPILVILGIAVVFVSVVTITNASLQAMSKPLAVVRSMMFGIFVKIIANYFLIAIPLINISGACFGTVLCFATISVLNLREINRHLNIELMIGKPFIASVFMAILIKTLQINYNISVIYLVSIGAVAYFLVLFLIGGLKELKDFTFKRT